MENPRGDGRPPLRVAATADVHCDSHCRDEVAAALEDAARKADLLLLAGDLTTYGRPEEAAMLAEICGRIEIPVLAVLGNHDWHSNKRDEVVAALAERSVRVLDGEATQLRVAGHDVGVVGVKGFIGGFPGSHLSDFGEPALRDLYRVTGAEVEALDRGLREIALCPIRLVILHYAPTADTLVGEPEGIWTFLGSDRLAAPILEHEPDLVVHGHAHAGTSEGRIGGVPVHNVSMFVMDEPYATFDLHARDRAAATIR
jgi:Icc-related predicted phosphoesterase